MAFYVDDAGGQEACFVGEGFPCAVVDVDGSVGGEAVEDPEVAVADGVGDGEEAGVEGDGGGVELGGGGSCGEGLRGGEVVGGMEGGGGGAGVVRVVGAVAAGGAGEALGFGVLDDGRDVAGFAGLGDDGRDAGAGGQAGGYDLGAHAAGSQGGAGAADVGFEVRDVFDDFDGLCVGVLPRVGVVETVDVRHEEEVVCLHHAGCDGAQGVVVAKFDFRDGQGVVLVDDGDDAHVEKFEEGVLCVLILRPVRDVVSCEQYLCNWLPHVPKQLIPETHEPTLAYGGKRLDLREVFWPSVEIHSAEAHANGTRGDEDHAVAIFVQLYGGLDNDSQDRQQGLVCLLVDDRGRAYIALVSYSRLCECGVGVQEVYRV